MSLLPSRRRGGATRVGPGRVRLGEWLFPLGLAVVLLYFIFLPYRDAESRSSDASRFMGLVGASAIDDNNVYLGLMRQSAEGETLFANNFTPEPNRPILFNLLYLSLGRISRLTGWSLDFTHRAFMALSALLLVLSVYSFIATGIRRPFYRRFALVLACLGGGFLWLARLIVRFTGLDLRPITSWLVEVNLFHAMMVYPHFVFAAALLTASLTLLLKAERERRFSAAAAAGCCAAVLASSHAFEAVAAIPIAVAYLVLDWMGRGESPSGNRWKCLALVVGIPIPMMLLNQWILNREPMWGNVVRRLDFSTPEPFRLAMGLGATFFITVLTFGGFLRMDRPAGERMARAWVLVVLILAYVPWINWRWHLLNGIQIPLAVLATQGLRRTLFLRILLRRRRARPPRATNRRAGRFSPALGAAMVTVVILCCLSAVNLLLSYRNEVNRVEGPTYLPSSQVEALDWMSREVSRDSVVFAAYLTGNYIPRLSGQRVFVGEDKLTADCEERMGQVRDFFSDHETDADREQLLRRSGVGYLFFGPEEKRLGPYDPSRAPFLRCVYDRQDVKIFRVEGTPAGGARASALPRPAKGNR